MGVSPTAVNTWVSGEKYPRIDKIEQLATLFNVSVTELIGEKEESPTDDGTLNTAQQKLLNSVQGLDDATIYKLIDTIEALKK